MDQKNHHKIPLNPPLPLFSTGIKRPKGELLASLWQREVGRDFIKLFQTAKMLQKIYILTPFSLRIYLRLFKMPQKISTPLRDCVVIPFMVRVPHHERITKS